MQDPAYLFRRTGAAGPGTLERMASMWAAVWKSPVATTMHVAG